MIFLSAQNIVPIDYPRTDKNIKKSVYNSALPVSFCKNQKTHNNKTDNSITYKELVAKGYTNNFHNQKIIKLSKNNPDFIRTLMNYKVDGEKRFNIEEIIKIAETNKGYPKEVKSLLDYKIDGKYRFGGHDIGFLAETYKENPKTVQELAEYKDDEGNFRFSGFVINSIARDYSKHKPKIKELIEYRIDDELRFNNDDICDLADIYAKNSKAVKGLAEIKNGQDYLYSGKEIKYLAQTYKDYPTGVKELSKVKKKDGSLRFGVYDIKTLAKHYKNHKNAILELAEITTSADEPRFFDEEIEFLIEPYEKYPKEVKELAEIEQSIGYPKFLTSDIKNAAPFYKNPEFKKYITENKDKIEHIKSISSDNFLEIEAENMIIHLKFDEDKNFRIVSKEIQERDDEKQSCILETSYGTIKIEQYNKKSKKPCEGYIETVTDKNGKVLSRTLTKPSKRNPDVLVVLKEILDSDGNLKEVQKLGTVENFGEEGERRRIKKTFISPLGVESKQLILEVPRGMRSLYQIGNKRFDRIFIKKDKNTTETRAWGNKYETKFSKDKIDITVTKKDKTQEKVTLNNEQADFKLLPLLKEMPGDYLYAITKADTALVHVTNDYLKDNAAFVEEINTIMMSKELQSDKFTFAHETGHMIDDIVLKGLHNNKKLKKIFNKELDAYKEKASDLNEEQILYFTKKEHKNEGGCLTEVIAETNAILSGLPHDGNNMLIRAKILQENFPETMKYIGEKIEKVMG